MSFSRMIKPYPQQESSYSVYRPAYHRIPSTGSVHKESSPEMTSPIVVPSMSNTLVYNQPTYAYYTFYRQQQQQVAVSIIKNV